MTPIAINVFGLSIHYYGILIGVGFLLAVSACQRKRQWAQLTEDQLINLAVMTMIAGIVGARINYVIKYYYQFEGRPLWELVAVWNGGLVFYGGFILAAIVLFFLAKRYHSSALKVTDLFSVGLPLGHAFGRLGCFMQGCCYGGKTDACIGFKYPDTINEAGKLNYPEIFSKFHEFPTIIPIQLIEAFFNFLIFGVLYTLIGKLRTGQITGIYLMSYGILRFVLEYFRGEYIEKDMLWGLFSPGQQIGLLIVPIGLIIFLFSTLNLTQNKHKQNVKNN